MSVDPTKVTPEEETVKTPAVDVPTEQPTTESAGRVPKLGDIVDYVLGEGQHPGEKRPAIIVRVWGDTPESYVNLQVFTDGVNDFTTAHPGGSGILWRTSVARDDTGQAKNTWSFPE
jgi:hypothetical protein